MTQKPASLPFPLLGVGLSAPAAWAWYALVMRRADRIQPHCLTSESCSSATLPVWDRWVVHFPHEARFDALSYGTQYAAGVLLFGMAFAMALSARGPGRLRARRLGLDLLWGFQVTFLNGALMEFTRGLVERPRPFVYLNPALHGGNAANYVSFYSGHTSFAAAACATAYLMLRSSGSRSLGAAAVTLSLGVALTFSTGLFRVLCGAHFVTDVAFAAVAGTLVALATERLQKRRSA